MNNFSTTRSTDTGVLPPQGCKDRNEVEPGGGPTHNVIALRFKAASEGGFDPDTSGSHRWFPDVSGSKPTIIAKKA